MPVKVLSDPVFGETSSGIQSGTYNTPNVDINTLRKMFGSYLPDYTDINGLSLVPQNYWQNAMSARLNQLGYGGKQYVLDLADPSKTSQSYHYGGYDTRIYLSPYKLSDPYAVGAWVYTGEGTPQTTSAVYGRGADPNYADLGWKWVSAFDPNTMDLSGVDRSLRNIADRRVNSDPVNDPNYTDPVNDPNYIGYTYISGEGAVAPIAEFYIDPSQLSGVGYTGLAREELNRLQSLGLAPRPNFSYDDGGWLGDLANVVTFGGYGAINALSSGDIQGALLSANTLGGNTLTAALPQNDLTNLMNSTIQSAATGGMNNIEAAASQENFANQMDYMIDPSRVNDRWIRGSGEMFGDVFGQDARQILGNYVLPIAATIATAPIGGWGGVPATYLGNKFTGGTDEQGLIKTGVAAGSYGAAQAAAPLTNSLTGSLAPMIGQTPAQIASNALTGATTGAATGSISAAAQGRDVGDAALWGAVKGGASGAAAPLTQSLTQQFVAAGANPQIASNLANTLVRVGTASGLAEAQGKDPLLAAQFAALSQGTTMGAQQLNAGINALINAQNEMDPTGVFGDLGGTPITYAEAIEAGATPDDLKQLGFSSSYFTETGNLAGDKINMASAIKDGATASDLYDMGFSPQAIVASGAPGAIDLFGDSMYAEDFKRSGMTLKDFGGVEPGVNLSKFLKTGLDYGVNALMQPSGPSGPAQPKPANQLNAKATKIGYNPTGTPNALGLKTVTPSWATGTNSQIRLNTPNIMTAQKPMAQSLVNLLNTNALLDFGQNNINRGQQNRLLKGM